MVGDCRAVQPTGDRGWSVGVSAFLALRTTTAWGTTIALNRESGTPRRQFFHCTTSAGAVGSSVIEH